VRRGVTVARNEKASVKVAPAAIRDSYTADGRALAAYSGRHVVDADPAGAPPTSG